MRQGKKVFVHGDGSSLWVMTHNTDFAKGFVGLLGNPHAIGDVFHITSDELLTWNQIYALVAKAAGVEAKVVHVPSDLIAAFDANIGAGLLGDKTHSVIFDNSKIKRLVPDFVCTTPFARGIEDVLAWYDANPDRQVINPDIDALTDRIVAAMESIWPK
jgi:nucleoside-diphosphate-sugar epimerase